MSDTPGAFPSGSRESRVRRLLEQDPVVVTGAGAVCAAGCGTEALWRTVAAGRATAEFLPLPLPGGGEMTVPACRVPGVSWAGHPWSRLARRLDAGAQYGLLAAEQAIRQAGLTDAPPDPVRFGVICGSSRGPNGKWQEVWEQLGTGRRVKPALAASTTLAAVAGAIGQAVGARGPSHVVSAACASGACAIAAAAEQILLGNADVMLAGGADDVMQAALFAGLQSAGVLASGPGDASGLCRPFQRDRTGLVPGSGAGMLVLEPLSLAVRRGAKPLAVLRGWGLALEPHGMVGIDPSGAGLQRAMKDALAVAGVAPADIDYINAHGTGTVANDAAEAAAILEVFGRGGPPVSSSKPATGHCLGATPVIEAVLCVEALLRGELPPAFPAGDPDPVCHGMVFSAGGPAPLRHALSSSAAFWGFHASLIFSRWQ